MAYSYKAYTPSGTVIDYKNKQDTATSNYSTYANKGYSQGAGGLGSQLSTAQSRLNALYNGNNLSQQFRYSNQGQYNKALNNITNRKAFEYDLSQDQLFQQAKEQYQVMGKSAMADTIGQASAMTGGYGNSYATSAGNQAYNAYLQELNNSIGDYYSMALNAYNSESDRLNNVFSALSTDRSNEASEWSNNWSVYNNLYSLYSSDYNNLLSNDMSAWQQKGTNLYNAANLATSQYSNASTNDINVWDKQEGYKAEEASQIETERHNRATEDYNNRSLAETIRSNQANEYNNRLSINESKRHNLVTESTASTNGSTSNKSTSGSSNATTITASSEAKELVTSIQEEMRSNQKATKAQKKAIVMKYINKDTTKDSDAAYLYQYFSYYFS